MFNVLLDELPHDWNGYELDTDFQTGIQITQALNDKELSEMERIYTAIGLLFESERLPDTNECMECLTWFLNGWNHDNHKKSSKPDEETMDFDIDQWRLYVAFREQYGINLNTDILHWWEFMALLSNLQECAFTRVLDIRAKKITAKMSNEEKKNITDAKRIYAIKHGEKQEELTEQEVEAVNEFQKLLKK